MKRLYTLSIFLIVVACSPRSSSPTMTSEDELTRTQKTTQTMTPNSTLTPSITPTLSPTFTATITPTSTPLIISEDNLKELCIYGQLGNGFTEQIVISSDGTRLAFSNTLGIYIYDTETLKQVKWIETDTRVISVAFSPDGNTLATGSGDDCTVGRYKSTSFSSGTCVERGDNNIRLWDISSGELLVTFVGHKQGVENLMFIHDGNTVLSKDYDGIVNFWDINTSEIIDTVKNVYGAMTVTPDERYLLYATLGVKDALEQYDIDNERVIRSRSGIEHIRSLKTNSDGSLLAIGTWDDIFVLDMQLFQIKHKLVGHIDPVESLAFSPSGMQLASGSSYEEKAIRLWSLETGEQLQILKGHTHKIIFLSFDESEKVLTSGGQDGTLNVWDIEESKIVKTHTAPVTLPQEIIFSPDGTLIASADDDGYVRIWDVASLSLLYMYGGHEGWVTSISFSYDGQLIASGDIGSTIRVWDIVQEEKLLTISHSNLPTSYFHRASHMAFSPNEEILAVGGRDGIVRIWDVLSGELINELVTGGVRINEIMFTKDGKYVLSLSKKSQDESLWQIMVWEVDTAEKINAFESANYILKVSKDSHAIGIVGEGGWSVRDIFTGDEIEKDIISNRNDPNGNLVVVSLPGDVYPDEVFIRARADSTNKYQLLTPPISYYFILYRTLTTDSIG